MAQPVKLRAVVERIEDHAPGLRSLWLKPERRVPRFKPGQFLHLALDPYDPSGHWPDSRCFSIASPPEHREMLRIAVSAVGAFTRRVMNLRTGDQVWVKLPYGDFIVTGGPGQTVVLVAGGTGMAPFVSLLASDKQPPCRLRVVYGVRRRNLLIFLPELQHATRNTHLTWQAVVGADPAPGDICGLITPDIVLEAGTGFVDRVYLSGPPAMVDALKVRLPAAGIPSEQIVVDAWA